MNGVASYFVINYCDVTAANFGYSDDGCVTDHSQFDVLSEAWLVNTKIISSYFEPDDYAKTG